MYSIKLHRGHGMNMDTIKLIDTIYCQLLWEEEEGKPEVITSARSCVWTPQTAVWAEKQARRDGLELKAEYGAYLRKHGERLEVVQRRKRDAKRAEEDRIRAIKDRCWSKSDKIIGALKIADPTLAHYLETGEESLPIKPLGEVIGRF